MILPILSSISSEQCLGKGTVLLLWGDALLDDRSALFVFGDALLGDE